jgi:hypothetical protein
MRDCADDEGDRRGAGRPEGRDAASGSGRGGSTPLDVCDEAHVAETYRLERPDEACDDGIG